MERPKRYSAFVYKVWKPLTYLLDIYFAGADVEAYRPYIYDTYRYVDGFEEGDAGSSALEGFDRSQAKRRPVYRCRIWGIQKISQGESGLTPSRYAALCSQAKIRMVRQLDPSDGWLKCDIDHVDDLGRLIAKLYEPKTGQLINGALLNETFSPIFDVYREPK